MMDFISVPIVVGIVFFSIYKLFELFVCRRERLNIIEKFTGSGVMPTLNKSTLDGYFRQRMSYGALKAGCLLIGVGLGLLIGYVICAASIPNYMEHYKDWNFKEIISIVYGSSVLLFGGIGLIAAFILELKIGKKNKETEK